MLLGPGVWAWIACHLERPLYDRCPYLSDSRRCRGQREGRGCVGVIGIVEEEQTYTTSIVLILECCVWRLRDLGLVNSVLFMVSLLY